VDFAHMLGAKPMAVAQTKSGVAYDPHAIEAIEARFFRDTWEAVRPEAAAEHGIALASFGPVQATIVRELPGVQIANMILGATAPGAVADGQLEAAIAWARERGANPKVPVPRGLEGSAEAEAFLRAAGFAPGYRWMKFVRDAHPPRFSVRDDVEVIELGAGSEEPFAAIVAAGFGLPAWAAELFVQLPGRPGWRCYVAKVDGSAQAAAAMFLDAGIAEFGMAATLEPARRRGCQLALLRRRLLDATAAGCELCFVETGERVPERPSNSYRNILRAGFEEAFLCPIWGASPPESAS
jgi:GNAT superfamily N-acetyltransferase